MSTPTAAELLRGVAAELAAAGVALYSPTGAYPAEPDRPAVVLSGALPKTPVLAVVVASYSWDTLTDSHNPAVSVQLRWRAKSMLAVEDVAFAGFKALHFTERTTAPRVYPNGVHVQRCTRVVTAPPEGPDANGNWERADSYRFILNPS